MPMPLHPRTSRDGVSTPSFVLARGAPTHPFREGNQDDFRGVPSRLQAEAGLADRIEGGPAHCLPSRRVPEHPAASRHPKDETSRVEPADRSALPWPRE